MRGAVTENRRQPGFLFPGVEACRAAPETGHPCLAMLGAKPARKDRRRQVLAGAAKIPRRHLLTRAPGTPEPQTTRMAKPNLQLVVPQASLEGYTAVRRDRLWNLGEFIRDVEARVHM